MTARLTSTGRAVAASAGAALLVLLPGVPVAVRIVVAAGFFLVGPGLAWVHALPVSGAVESGATAVALSLALDVLVAEILLFAGLPGLFPAALLLVAVALGGVAVNARRTAAPAPTATPGTPA